MYSMACSKSRRDPVLDRFTLLACAWRPDTTRALVVEFVWGYDYRCFGVCSL